MMLFIVVTALLVALAIFIAGPQRLQLKRVLPLCIAISAVIFKLWLVSWQDLIGHGTAGHDDFLFIKLAAFIADGEWLGAYDHLTLIKGPFYSLWMVFLYELGIPLLLGNQLLYTFASIIAVISLRPVIKSDWGLLIMFLVVLFNPMTFSLGHVARVDRFGIYPAQTLLVHACAVGLLLRYSQTLRENIGWFIGLGVSLGLFLITREAAFWVYPGILLMAIVMMFFPSLKFEAFSRDRLIPWALVLLLAVIPSQIISFANWKAYEFWGVTEYGNTSFAKAYGALNRVLPKSFNMRVPVSQDSRALVYKQSPAFAELEPLLEGWIGDSWSLTSERELEQEMEGEIAGGWFMWALRDAAFYSLKHQWFGKSEDFYRRVAEETNTACDEGRLNCLPARNWFGPVLSGKQFIPTLKTFGGALLQSVKFSQYLPHSADSTGQDWMLNMFKDYTGERLSTNWQDIAPTKIYVDKQIRAERALLKIHKQYRQWAPFCAVGLSILLIFQLVRWKHLVLLDKLLALSAVAVVGNMMVYTLMLSYMEVTSVLTIKHQYIYPNHALLCWVIAFGMVSFLSGSRGYLEKKTN
ncbi:MAG: hypothetical protein P8J68_07640 [Arenicellaceae bacterium]|nr:hypothetical protein [Arenicellaceae bacterium]